MSKITRQDLLDLLVMRVIEGKVSQDNAAFVQEQLNFVEPDLTVRSVDFVSSRTCDFGHLLDQQTRLVAVCERCGLHTCSAPGCGFTCTRCGIALCRRHASVYAEGEAYCTTCHLLALVRWLVLGKRR